MTTAAPAGLARALADAGEGHDRLQYFRSVGSTNDIALQLAADGAPAGTAVLAEQQTSGRGRQGRTWSSPPGAGIYLTVIGREPALAGGPGRLTLGAGVAVVEAIRAATALPVVLKWPNDVVIGERWRKIGGLLAEAQGRAAVVIGVGLNVTPAAHPPDVQRRATDLETELGRAVDRDALIAALVIRLRALVGTADAGGGAWVGRWRALAAPGWQGAAVRWPDGEGVARDIDPDGALIVERAGRRERVMAGEVVWTRHP